jgi:DNA mismatch repair protein MutL
MSIRVLTPTVANQIAAGEVVERPASAVKELIENSLDAGATDLRVEIREGGRRLIRIQDDGCGIAQADTALLFQRHATSKIATAGDLDHLITLGFRGEALASIGSVAEVTLLTCAAGEPVGTLLQVNGGQELSREARGAPPGTTITVEHLFANVPARLKFLKQPATEAGQVMQIITRYALAYPERRFSLISDGKQVFQSTGSGKLYDVLIKVYGLDMARQMLALEHAAAPPLAVTGYIGTPSLHRANRSYISLFVNRRWFQDSSLAYSLIQAYHTLLPVGRYPVGLVFIEMDPGDVDVNVHPAKAEVRFRDNGAVFSAVQRTVRRTLTEHAPIPSVSMGDGADVAVDSEHRQLSWDEDWATRRQVLLGAGTNLPRPAAGTGQDHAETGQDRAAGREQMAAGPWRVPMPDLPDRPMDLAPPKIPILRVVGQLVGTYIVAEGPDGMYLIDQHAAHERILYEQMVANRATGSVPVQPLLAPTVVELSPEQTAVVAGELDGLHELGVDLEPFGPTSYLLRSVPAILSRDDPDRALAEILDGLLGREDIVESAHEARLVTLICKRAAVKGGHVLSFPEMQELVRQLEQCRSPRTCPHGRPTMVHVSAGELARQFGRT